MATIRITAQYYENYSDTDTPHWKPKGGQEFVINGVSDEVLLYGEPEVLTETLTDLVESYSNEFAQYHYVDHEVLFVKPVEIDVDVFNKQREKIQELIDQSPAHFTPDNDLDPAGGYGLSSHV